MNRAICIMALFVLPALGLGQEKAGAPQPVAKSFPEPDFILRDKDLKPQKGGVVLAQWRATAREEPRALLRYMVPTGTAMIQEDVPKTCPITKPPALPFIPPSPYPAKTGPDRFWFGTEELWINLPKDGTWRGLSHYRPTDSAFRQKLMWWRQGYDWHEEPQPKLKVTGKRLDSPAPPLVADEAHAGGRDLHHPFMMVGIDIPTLGCWEITGHYEDTGLNFVILVAQ